MSTTEDNTKIKSKDSQAADGEVKVEKYLTQMKELSDSRGKAEKPVTENKPKVKNTTPPLQKTEEQVKVSVEKKQIETKTVVPAAKAKPLMEDADLNDSSYKVYSTRDLILGVINIFTLALLVFLLIKLPARAEELKAAKNESMKYHAGSAFELPDIAENMQTAERIEKVFLDTAGIVDFVSHIESIKAQGGTITKLSFANQNAVLDKTQNYGIPVVIEMRGNLQDMIVDIDKIKNLPFLFRPVSIEIAPSKDNPSLLEFKYGGLIYVNDKLGKDR